jgi:hypothetical protein
MAVLELGDLLTAVRGRCPLLKPWSAMGKKNSPHRWNGYGLAWCA